MDRTDISRIKTAIETGHRAPGLLSEVMREASGMKCRVLAGMQLTKLENGSYRRTVEPCGECLPCIAKEVTQNAN